MKYSFVIPVYNVESYLEECVQSLLKQTYCDFEVILVNDGSTDKSGALCESLSHVDPRITVVHQDNSGLSEARNTGLRVASSEYVIFLDSDDYWLGEDSLYKLNIYISEFKSVDMLCFKRRYAYSSGSIVAPKKEYTLIKDDVHTDDILESLLASGEFECHACLKVIRTSFLIDNGLFFKPGLLSEDVEWFVRCLLKLEILKLAPISCYAYRCQREGSITNSISVRNLEHLLDTIESFYNSNILNDSVISAKKKEIILSFLAYQLSIVIGYIASLPRENRFLIKNRVVNLRKLLIYQLNPKVKKVERIISILGVTLGSYILYLYIFIRRLGLVGKK